MSMMNKKISKIFSPYTINIINIYLMRNAHCHLVSRKKNESGLESEIPIINRNFVLKIG